MSKNYITEFRCEGDTEFKKFSKKLVESGKSITLFIRCRDMETGEIIDEREITIKRINETVKNGKKVVSINTLQQGRGFTLLTEGKRQTKQLIESIHSNYIKRIDVKNKIDANELKSQIIHKMDTCDLPTLIKMLEC